MLSKTLEDGLSKYSIGEKLRALRFRKKLGLVDLGKHTGLSPALLSKIENGKLFPTLPTLFRIAMVVNVGLEHFFAATEGGPVLAVVRRKDRQRFPESPDAKDVAYHFESLDFPAQRVFDGSIRVATRYLTLLARPNDLGHPRLGLAISRKSVKLAVNRNQIKRQVRESFRLNQELLGGIDVVIMARGGVETWDWQELRATLEGKWRELRKRCKNS